MKLFKSYKWKTIQVHDVVVTERVKWLFFLEITYTSVWKIFVQITDEHRRCFITNGVRIYDYDINDLIKLQSETK
jgi:hypothetical protein